MSMEDMNPLKKQRYEENMLIMKCCNSIFLLQFVLFNINTLSLLSNPRGFDFLSKAHIHTVINNVYMHCKFIIENPQFPFGVFVINCMIMCIYFKATKDISNYVIEQHNQINNI